MPRNISFALTTAQFRNRTKDVTRRNGWLFLKAGDILCAVEKSQGIPKGGKVKRLGMIRVVHVRREPLRRMLDRPDYGREECRREGYPSPHPKSSPTVFVEFFCESHRGVMPESIITRITYEYI